MYLITQIPTPPPGSIESVALALAAIASLIVLGRKLVQRTPPGETVFVTKSEFHTQLDGLRDKIDARFLNMMEKIDTLKTELLNAVQDRGDSLHRRVNELESGLARVDERTKQPRGENK